MKVAIIGGGAAGYFAAITVAETHPSAKVVLFEKGDKPLSKVKVSGGGRCNVTHHNFDPVYLSKCYPRGKNQLKKAFHIFNPSHTIDWFANKGVELYAQDDNRMFPISDDSQTVIDCFQDNMHKLGIRVVTKRTISKLIPKESSWQLCFKNEEVQTFNKIVVCTGGGRKITDFDWLKELGHEIVPPVPSLFTFNMPKHPITKLMGLSVPKVSVQIQGTKLKSNGAMLITHWGLSGPAVLKLSAFGARTLSEKNYQFSITVKWSGDLAHSEIEEMLNNLVTKKGGKQLKNLRPFDIPTRLWAYLLGKKDIDPERTWGSMNPKSVHKLIDLLTNDNYEIKGKTTFKEEFVTAGGIKLTDVDFKTMESKKQPGLYFAGEVLDIDGITGGFNFQAAWTTAFIAGQLSSNS